MTTTDWLRVALGVLPSFPHQTTAMRNDGGRLPIELIEACDGCLHVQLSLLEARAGLRITIPIKSADGGGYDVGCEIREVFFLGGLESAAKLEITEVRRRKPYRGKTRLDCHSLASLHVIKSNQYDLATSVPARVLDISSSGIGLSVDTPFDAGDRVRVDSVVNGIPIHGEATVVQTSRLPFGRWRVGCHFTHLPLRTQHLLDQLASQADSSAERTGGGTVAA